MGKAEIKKAIAILENIVNYHNKNLTKKQYFQLDEALEILKAEESKKQKYYVLTELVE